MLGVVLVAFAMIGVPLPQGDLQHDAPMYAFVPLRVAATGDALRLYLDWDGHLAYFNKPPLQFWLSAVGYQILGVSVWSARLVPALSWLAAAVGLYGLLRRLGRTAAFAATAAVLLLLQREVYKNALQVRLDGGMVVGFLVASAAALSLADDRGRRWRDWLLLGGGAGFSLLYRGLPALMCLLVFVAFLAWSRRWRTLFDWRGWLLAAAAIFVVGGWWFAVQLALFREDFAAQLSADAVVKITSAAGRTPWYEFLTYYVQRIPESFAVALLPAALGVVHVLRRPRRRDGSRLTPLERLAATWVLVWIALIHLSPLQSARYVLPAVPWICVFGAVGLTRTPRLSGLWARLLPWAGPAAAVVAVGLMLAGVQVSGERDDALRDAAAKIAADRALRPPPQSPAVYAYNGGGKVGGQKLCAVAFYTRLRARPLRDDSAAPRPGDYLAVFVAEGDPAAERPGLELLAGDDRWRVYRVLE